MGSAILALFTGAGGVLAEKGHHPHYPYLAGVKAVGMGHLENGETGRGGGAGVFLERAIVEDLLDVEISLVGAVVEEDTVVPVDLIVKTPVYTTHSFTFYAGGGASLTYERLEDESLLRPGIAVQTGIYWWFWEHTGIDVELDYNLLLTPEIGHELNVAIGPMMRF